MENMVDLNLDAWPIVTTARAILPVQRKALVAKLLSELPPADRAEIISSYCNLCGDSEE